MDSPKLTLQQVLSMDLPPVIVYAVPAMIFFVVLEWILSWKEQRETYDIKDTMAATVVGVGNVLTSALLKTVNFAVVLYFYNLVPWSIPPKWWSYILCLLAIDFFRYWAHRVAHEQRMWWATHVTHHSSIKYNFSVSFRLGWTQYIKIIFFIPVALMGFHPLVFFIIHQIEVLYQFWIHTEYIKKMPRIIEFIFTTPSHHRVHHATNPQYLDKNYGSTLIIWDRIFGTFEPENEKPIYGITKPVNSYNPIYLVFHEWIDIFKDLKRARTFKQVWQVLFYPPGFDVFGDEIATNEKVVEKPAAVVPEPSPR